MEPENTVSIVVISRWWLSTTSACYGQQTVAFSITLADILFSRVHINQDVLPGTRPVTSVQGLRGGIYPTLGLSVVPRVSPVVSLHHLVNVEAHFHDFIIRHT